MNDRAHFRVWAPKCAGVELVVLDDADAVREVDRRALESEGNGYFSGEYPTTSEILYGLQPAGQPRWFPDPASRFQPRGPEGPSQVIDPSRFAWTDAAWRGVEARGQVIYEMHVGTFTPEGTWAAAMEQLPELARIGMTLLEIMPLADFFGEFGWGYDGVNQFAPTRLYGRPDDLRAFVDRAHQLGLGVVLDVVYNHFGPVGNYLAQFSDHYFTDRHVTEWGAAVNFDDADSAPVREYFLANVRYWIEEFHLDGYRFDATQAIVDASSHHILAAFSAEARAAAPGRTIHLSVENQPQDVANLRSVESGGFGMDGIWNDDFHHAARVCATGRNEGYYRDFTGQAHELVSACRHAFLYQGQARANGHLRGTSTRGFPACSFVTFLQNHDQVANSAYGKRLHQITTMARFRALTALWLLSPQTPMFLQGQEYCASQPFLYFADLAEELGRVVWEGRKSFLRQFANLATLEMQAALPDPCSRATFERCKLSFAERESHAAEYRLHADLLALRRTDPVIQRQTCVDLEGVAFADHALALRYFTDEGNDRLILANFGADLPLRPTSQPILAPPDGRKWELAWSSERPAYGGDGTSPWRTESGWRLSGDSTILLTAYLEK